MQYAYAKNTRKCGERTVPPSKAKNARKSSERMVPPSKKRMLGKVVNARFLLVCRFLYFTNNVKCFPTNISNMIVQTFHERLILSTNIERIFGP